MPIYVPFSYKYVSFSNQSDFSGNSMRYESDKDITVVPRVSPGKHNNYMQYF